MWITLLNMDEVCKADLRKGGRLDSESPQVRIPNWQNKGNKKEVKRGLNIDYDNEEVNLVGFSLLDNESYFDWFICD